MKKRIKVLLADDHELVRRGLRALLEAAGAQPHRELNLDLELEVIEAADGLEAVELARKHQPEVALLDLVMPKLDGLRATEAIRAASPTTKVLVLSQYAHVEYILRAAEAGASGYLLKESTLEELLEAIAQAVRAGAGRPHPGSFYLSRKLKAVDIAGLSRSWRAHRQARPGPDRARRQGLLTPREREVLELIAQGLTTREIAARLGLSPKTVEAHRAKLARKLGARTTADLVRCARMHCSSGLDD